MRTIHCSGRLGGGGGEVAWGVSVGGVCLGGVHPQWTDRCLWKHYLAATTVVDGKNQNNPSIIPIVNDKEVNQQKLVTNH